MNVADICPVGALTTKDFRFKIRVWFLEDVPGVCTGCANGCNVHLGVANNRVYRYTPRRNDAVNQTWLCDEGRLSYKRINADDRIDHAAVRNADGNHVAVPYETALETAAARIRRVIETKGAGAVGMLVSPHATNEDLAVARRFLDALGSTQAGFALVRGRKDELLIKEEKAANAAGARAHGFEDAAPLLERVRGGAVEALLVMGHDVLAPAYANGRAALEGVDTLVLLDTHRSQLEALAHVVLPVRHAAEKHGTLTNVAGLRAGGAARRRAGLRSARRGRSAVATRPTARPARLRSAASPRPDGGVAWKRCSRSSSRRSSSSSSRWRPSRPSSPGSSASRAP